MRRFAAAFTVFLATAAISPTLFTPAQAAGDVVVSTVSNRADLISGGDAMVRVELPTGADATKLKVTVGDRDVTSAFAERSSGHIEGLVTELIVGENVVTATIPGQGARLTITNHPNGGPVFAGPQLEPWVCQGSAQDAACNQDPSFSYLYKPTGGSAFKEYDPANPPSDVDTTTTDNNVTVPFIVRVEKGYSDRDQYAISVLFQPGEPWTGVAPQPQFDRKVLFTHGASCGVDHNTGGAPDTTGFGSTATPIGGTPATALMSALGRGNVVASHALNNSGHNCNIALQAEAMMMLKERIQEQYGSLRFGIGIGCSGGSLTIQWVANAYPGIYDGILPTCSFPDAWSTATQFLDYHLLLDYFKDPTKWGTGVVWLPTQMAAVQNHVTIVNSEVSDNAQWHVAVPTDPCSGVTDAQRYNPDTNPTGVRCSIQDAAINVFGPNPQDHWYPQETNAGKGFALPPIDNAGVQYGLESLNEGLITPAQFVDLNQKIGGVDIDTNIVPERIDVGHGDALGRAYRSGMINEANNLDRVPIIDCRGPDPGAFHDAYRAFAMRDRLDREHGTHANQLIWQGPEPILGDIKCQDIGLVAMDGWLSAIEADPSTASLGQKVIDNKPSDLTDRCYSGAGQKLTDELCPEAVMTVYGTPRMVAGQPRTTDSNKCQLKPLDRADYPSGPLGLSDDQFAALEQLFPDGVCDFSKPGVQQEGTVPWQTYQEADGSVIYGGEPMDGAPVSVPFAVPVPPVVTCGGVKATIVGSSSGQTINGTSGNDVIQAFGGNDVVNGRGGNDRICGSDGSDRLVGGTGHDVLYGGAGSDNLSGEDGTDQLAGGSGADRLSGGAGYDRVFYSDHLSAVVATIGNGKADDGNSTDGPKGARDAISSTVEGLFGTAGADRLYGNSSANVLNGLGGSDVVHGSSGNDHVVGGSGADGLYGDAGNDTLKAKDGVRDTRIDGGTGTDTATRDSRDPTPVSVP